MKNWFDHHLGRVHLHWLFTLIVLIAVMPVFVLYFGRLQTSRADALSEARSQVYQLASRAADVYSDITIKSRHVLETVGANSSVRKNRDCGAFFKWVQHLVVGHGTTPWITGLFLTDAHGKYICGSFSNGNTADVGDREYFRGMMETQQFATSGILLGRYSHRMIVGAALPLYDDHNKLEMAVVLGADLYQLNGIAAEANERFGARLLVFNDSGHVLANLPAESKASMHQFDKPMVIKKLLQSDASTLEVADQSGVRNIYGVRRLPHGQRVAIALSRDAILGADRAHLPLRPSLPVARGCGLGGCLADRRRIRSAARRTHSEGRGAASQGWQDGRAGKTAAPGCGGARRPRANL